MFEFVKGFCLAHGGCVFSRSFCGFFVLVDVPCWRMRILFPKRRSLVLVRIASPKTIR